MCTVQKAWLAWQACCSIASVASVPLQNQGSTCYSISCTAVAWARAFMKKRPLDRSAGMPGMITQLRRVLQDGEDYINSEYDVDKLCGGEFLERMAELKDREGDRLKH